LAAGALLLAAGCSRLGVRVDLDDRSEEADRAALQRLREDFVVYVNAGDGRALAGLLAEDAVIIPQSVPEVSGIEACEQYYRNMFSKWEFRLVATSAELSVIGDLGIDRGTTESIIISRQDGKTYNSRGKYLMISRRQPDGSWKVWRDIANYSDK
jgi:ketosteroid isomerase-like protein